MLGGAWPPFPAPRATDAVAGLAAPLPPGLVAATETGRTDAAEPGRGRALLFRLPWVESGGGFRGAGAKWIWLLTRTSVSVTWGWGLTRR